MASLVAPFGSLAVGGYLHIFLSIYAASCSLYLHVQSAKADFADFALLTTMAFMASMRAAIATMVMVVTLVTRLPCPLPQSQSKRRA